MSDDSGAQPPADHARLMIPISPGELIDKITILDIKSRRIADAAKLAHVRRELELLRRVQRDSLPKNPDIVALAGELAAANEVLWDIEDQLRQCEARQDFGPEFIRLARSVYGTNDRRAELKRRINHRLGSQLVEVKDFPRSQ